MRDGFDILLPKVSEYSVVKSKLPAANLLRLGNQFFVQLFHKDPYFYSHNWRPIL